LAAAPQVQVDKQASAHRPARIDALPASAQKSTEQKALEREPATQAPDAVLRESATRRARDSSAGGEDTFGEDEEASIPAAEIAIDEKTAGGASALVVKPAIVPLSSPEQVPAPAGPAFHEAEGTDRWLWVDPRQEQGYSPAGFDVAAFLDRAIDLFRSKPWTGEKKPRRLAVHPSAIGEPLETAAEERDLELVADPKVTAGTYMLALAEREKVGD
jgi:hypothetical protein